MQKQISEKKALILREHMGGELENLYHYFLELNLADEEALGKLNPEDLKNAIGALLIYCPVYRFYGNRFPLGDEDFKAIKKYSAPSEKTGPNWVLQLLSWKMPCFIHPPKTTMILTAAPCFFTSAACSLPVR